MKWVIMGVLCFCASQIFGQSNANTCKDIGMDQIIRVTSNTDSIEQQCLVGDFIGATADTISDLCIDDLLATIWYQIIPDDDVLDLSISVVPQGCWSAVWALYVTQEDCDNLVLVESFGIDPENICGYSPDILNINFDNSSDSNRYYLLIQTDQIWDDSSFDLCVFSTTNLVQDCTQDLNECGVSDDYVVEVRSREYAGPLTGPFYPGEQLEVCVEYFFNGSASGVSWLMAVIPTLGDGWSLDNLDLGSVVMSPSGNQWFESGDTLGPQIQKDVPLYCTFLNERGDLELCDYNCQQCLECEKIGMKNGDDLPSGWYWITSGGLAGCSNDGSPGEGYGIGSSTVIISFCMDLEVASQAEGNYCICEKDLSIGLHPLADDIAGCWVDPNACNLYSKQERSVGTVFQQAPLEITITDSTTCSGSAINIGFFSSWDNVQILATANNNAAISGATIDTQVYDYNNGFIVDTLINTTNTIQTQSYIITTQDRDQNCNVRLDMVSIDVLPQINIQNDNDYVCQGDSLIISPHYMSITGLNESIDWSFESSGLNASVQGDELIIDQDNQVGEYDLQLTISRDIDGFICAESKGITINIGDIVEQSITPTICSGDQIVIRGQVFDMNNPTGTIQVEGVSQCDTTIYVSVSFYSDEPVQLSYELCEGEEIEIFGVLYGTEVNDSILQLIGGASTGCDSIVNLNIEVLAESFNLIHQAVCQGSYYVYEGDTLTIPTLYEFVYPAQAFNGCDSTLYINLIFVPDNIQGTTELTICNGDEVIFNDSLINTPGTYQTILPELGSGGCDSLDILILRLYPDLFINTSIVADNGSGSGSIDLSATGDISMINWSTGEQDTLIIGNLSFGSYSATITDDNGCISFHDFEVPLESSSKDVSLDQVFVYPNPSSGIFNLSKGELAIDMISIMDLQGQLVLRQVVTNTIDLSGQPKGVYVLSIHISDGTILNKKLVKI